MEDGNDAAGRNTQVLGDARLGSDDFIRHGDLSGIDILLVGGLNKDVIVPGSFTEEATLSASLRPRIGGSTPITAIAAGQLGLKTGYLAAVGIEHDTILEMLKGYETPFMLRYEADKMTPTSFIIETARGTKVGAKNSGFRTEDGEREAAELYPGDPGLFQEMVDDPKAIFLTSYLSNPQIVPDEMARMLIDFRANGKLTLFDMTEPSTKWADGSLEGLVEDVVPNVDVFTANDKELYWVMRGEDDKQYDLHQLGEMQAYMVRDRCVSFAERLLEKGVGLVNIHYGENGTLLVNPKGWVHVRPPYHDGELHSTGNGNHQCAGLMMRLPLDRDPSGLEIDELVEIARPANVAALFSVQGKPYPTVEQVREVLDTYDNGVTTSADAPKQKHYDVG